MHHDATHVTRHTASACPVVIFDYELHKRDHSSSLSERRCTLSDYADVLVIQ